MKIKLNELKKMIKEEIKKNHSIKLDWVDNNDLNGYKAATRFNLIAKRIKRDHGAVKVWFIGSIESITQLLNYYLDNDQEDVKWYLENVLDK